MKSAPLPTLALLLLAQCTKHDPDPTSQLPPATQTGANTFGCLLNGQPWTLSGNYGPANFRLTYDPGYHNGTLQVKTYRFADKQGNILQGLTFGATNVTKAGAYSFALGGDNGVIYLDTGQAAPCNQYSYSSSLTYQTGTLLITRFDLAQGVIAGTFGFKLFRPGCDALRRGASTTSFSSPFSLSHP